MSRRRSKKSPWLAVAILVAALGLGIATWTLILDDSKPGVRTDETTTVEPTDDEASDQEPTDDEDPSPTHEDPADPTKDDPKPTPQPSKVTLTIIRKDQSSGTVAAIISGASSGTCDVRYVKGGATVNGSGAIQYNPGGYYSCNVRMDRDDFPTAGTWKFTITADTPKGDASATDSVTIK